MLKFLSDALVSDMYSLASLVRTMRVDETTAQDPAWATTLITIGDPDDALKVLKYLSVGMTRVQGYSPRIPRAYADPTYAIAATNVDRIRNGGSSSTPAQAWR
jgi:hypothetical protein